MADVLAIDLWQCNVTDECYCHVAIVFATYVFCLADVVAMLLSCFRMDGDVITIYHLEEAMFDTGKSLSIIKKLVLFLRKSN